ncbi:MAG TPA: DUF1501 domain-containing protein [Planctomycetaceae bacterium]|jgi:hypothetical protein
MGTCDRLSSSRRSFLRTGALGGLSLSLADYLRRQAAGDVSARHTADAAIFISLQGGPSHLDMFDMKPDAPAEYRGEFSPIDTSIAGFRVCQHLPHLAQCAGRFSVIRSVAHNLADHSLGQQYVVTGNRPAAGTDYPGLGALAIKERGAIAPDLPPFVAIPDTAQRGGYLGVGYSPLETQAQPTPRSPLKVRGISLANGVLPAEIAKRDKLRRELDRGLERLADEDELLHGLDEFSERALTIIMSDKTSEAFDLPKESPSFAAPFGATGFGLSCLAALRLVERGVRFVTLTNPGWDTHGNNFTTLKRTLLPDFDQGLAALLNGLHERGLLEKTAIVVTGEFGRTPRINSGAGRDHFPQAMTVVMAGGGITGGRVFGATDELGMAPVDFACSPGDIAASFLNSLGIDHHKENTTNTGRPLRLVGVGRVIPELFESQ